MSIVQIYVHVWLYLQYTYCLFVMNKIDIYYPLVTCIVYVATLHKIKS